MSKFDFGSIVADSMFTIINSEEHKSLFKTAAKACCDCDSKCSKKCPCKKDGECKKACKPCLEMKKKASEHCKCKVCKDHDKCTKTCVCYEDEDDCGDKMSVANIIRTLTKISAEQEALGLVEESMATLKIIAGMLDDLPEIPEGGPDDLDFSASEKAEKDLADSLTSVTQTAPLDTNIDDFILNNPGRKDHPNHPIPRKEPKENTVVPGRMERELEEIEEASSSPKTILYHPEKSSFKNELTTDVGSDDSLFPNDDLISYKEPSKEDENYSVRLDSGDYVPYKNLTLKEKMELGTGAGLYDQLDIDPDQLSYDDISRTDEDDDEPSHPYLEDENYSDDEITVASRQVDKYIAKFAQSMGDFDDAGEDAEMDAILNSDEDPYGSPEGDDEDLESLLDSLEEEEEDEDSDDESGEDFEDEPDYDLDDVDSDHEDQLDLDDMNEIMFW